jgi:ABC-type transport system substrate-binding protein
MPEIQKLDSKDIEALLAKQGYKKVDGRFVKIPQSTGGISRDLQAGSSGEEVKKLQQCLAKDPQVYADGTVSGSFGSLTKAAVVKFQEKYAAQILAPQGLKSGTGQVRGGTRDKLNELCFPQDKTPVPLRLAITTLDQYPLKDVAEFVKNTWEAFGITTTVQTFSQAELERDIIKPRNYEVLLFGEILGKIPDPFPFWHSSQVKDPGLNLSGLENKKLDSTLLKLRRESDQEKRKELLEEAQDILVGEYPAQVLYDTPYLYFTASELKGIKGNLVSDPSERFAGVEEWYIKTKRVLK